MSGPSFAEATRVFARIGLLSFGGPAAQIALMHKEIVDRGWLSERRFLSALSFCMLLPGPEAMQLAAYSGWRLHGLRGGLTAGLLFVLPGALVVGVLAAIYAAYGAAPLTAALFLGVKAAVIAIVLEALLRVSKRALRAPAHWGIAAAAFFGIFFLDLPFPLILLAAALVGMLALKSDAAEAAEAPPPGWGWLRTVFLWLALWWIPLLALWAAGAQRLWEIGLFFAKLAVVTFGGAYAVLAYMAQEAVEERGWLSAGAMMDGLGLAETTPGPLILVTEFVGYLAGYGACGWGCGLLAALVTLWATFVPCFLWIFAGAPYVDWLTAQPRLRGALDAITAAVVGVILNLSLWFALHVLFANVERREAGPLTLWTPDLASFDWRAAALAGLAALLLLRLHWGAATVLALCAALGVAMAYAF